MVSDEAGSQGLYWNDLRITGGSEPLELGANNSGKGVGGSTVHFAGFCPRFHPSDFRVKALDGVAADWPIAYEDLEPYYEQMEREYPVSGPARYPWGKPHGYPYAPLQACTAGQKLIEEFYETDPRNDFVRGYALQSVAPLPIAMAHLITEEEGVYGEALLRAMQDYNHYAAIGVLGEILPDARNYVALHPTEKDQFGLPVPYVHFNLFENDRRVMWVGIARARAVLAAAGATETHVVRRYAHLVGTCRMGFAPSDSVVDGWCRTWDVPNLFVCDGSVLPTQGSANPALAISALAARTADWIRRAAPRGDLDRRAT